MTQTRSRVQWHRGLLLLLDAALLALAFVIAMWLRFEGQIPPVWWTFFALSILWIAPALLVFGFIFGLYNRVWEFARSEAAFAITFAVTGGVGFGSAGIFYSQPVNYSRSVLLMTWVLTILLIGSSRFGWRQMRRSLRLDGSSGRGARTPVLVYGAGETGASFVHHLERSPEPPYRMLGFVDDDQSLNRMIVAGYRVLGRGSDLPALVEKLSAEEVILAAPSVSGERIRRMLDHVRAAGVRARTLPRLLETSDGGSAFKDVRDVRYEDLLGRDMADIDLMLDPDYIGGRTVLVTGAGGSIGSEICRQLCRYEPREIILLGRGENRIHSIYRELLVAFPQITVTPCICNFTNAEHVREVFAQHKPHVVFHAGAHKHVYLMEDQPAEAVRNNVVGTGNVALAAAQAGVERFVAISTDKAVEPCNVMGATKRLSELLLLGLDRESETKFSIVRFGNVIGSSGSVLTIFQRQAQEGLPLTVTHREATRFFMTVQEAAFLVLQAGALGEGGDVYVLEMGQPVCIYQMAREFLQLNGRDPEEPGAIIVTTLSHGEKLHERLYSSREDINPTRCSRVLRVSMRAEPELSITPSELIARAQRATKNAHLAEDLLHTVYEATPISTPPLVLMTGQ